MHTEEMCVVSCFFWNSQRCVY